MSISDPLRATRVAELSRQFLVDEPPSPPVKKRRMFTPPTPRPLAPKSGKQLLQWVIEEADEQVTLGARPAVVRVSRRDLLHLRYLLQWIDGKERETEV